MLAHVGGPVLAPFQLAPLALAAVLYAMRVRTLARRGRPVPGERQACWYAGLTVILLALASPLSHIADELFLAHMVEHLLIADLGALYPVTTVLLARVVLGERLTRTQDVGVLVVMAGVALIAAG